MTATTTPAAAAAAPVKYIFRGEGNGLFQRASWVAGRLISRIASVVLFRLHVSGQATIPPTGGVLLISNHQSFLDPWLMGIAPSRQVHYMARDTLFNKTGGIGGFLHYLLELWNAFPVKRGAADLGAIRTAVERLDKGFVLNIFPEGTRTEDGSIGNIAPGMVLILNRCKSDVPIVPVLIDGAYEAWPRSMKLPRPHPIRIVYGKPIPASVWRQWSAEELALRVRRALVGLQATVHSAHTEASEARVARDEAEMAAQAASGGAPKRRRR